MRGETPTSFFTHVHNTLHSIISKFEVYSHKQQIFISNGLYAHKSHSFHEKAVTVDKGEMHCEGFEYKESPGELMDARLFEPFMIWRMKTLRTLNGFLSYGNLGDDSFSNSHFLHSNMKKALTKKSRLQFLLY